MSVGTALAIYFLIWWTVLFAVLPIGTRSQAEEGVIVPGSASGAPSRPRLLFKAALTTVVSSLVFALVYWLLVYKPIALDDLPMPF